MRRDPLLALARLRRLGLEVAERELAACQRATLAAEQEHAASRAAIGQEAAAAAEMAVAASASTSASAASAYAIWLPAGLAAARDAAARQQACEQDSAAAQSQVAARRAAKRAVAVLLEQRAALRQSEAGRREQAVLDEHGQRRSAAINPARPS